MKTASLNDFQFNDDVLQMHVRATEYELSDGSFTWRVSWSTNVRIGVLDAEPLVTRKCLSREEAVSLSTGLIQLMARHIMELDGLE